MNDRVTTVATLLAMGALGACVPLKQAPLIYTSKVQVGIHVAAANPETPGIDLGIGVNAVDAAYVPVAVARDCEGRSPANCASDSYDLIRILGDNDVQSTDTASEVALQDAKRDLQRASDDVTTMETQIAELENAVTIANTRLAALEARQTASQVPPASPGAPDEAQAADQPLLDSLTNEIGSVTDDKDRDVTALNQARQTLVPVITERNQLLARVSSLEAARDLRRGNKKTDALSVFGSFDADASAGGSMPSGQKPDASAGVVLGKVFSTGVAAQHLTQGIADSAKVGAMTQCMAQARQMPNPADVSIALKACASAAAIR